MKRFALMALLAIAGCHHAAGKTKVSVSFAEFPAGGGAITFETLNAKGTITVAPPMVVHYELKQVDFDTTKRWTIDGREFEFDGEGLQLGGKSYGALKGESSIEIRADGVFVNGEKRGELMR